MRHLLIKAINSTPILCIFLILVTLAMIMIGCGQERPPLDTGFPGGGDEHTNGSINWLRTIGVMGIAAVVGIAAANSVKWWMAAIAGFGTLTGLSLALKYYEEYVGLIFFIAIGFAAMTLLISLFVKHKGVFFAWRGKK